eukprot:gb/GECG01001056.1/.p1 GENE.gb/GECG01001056.1/~~gb/GECG01001056.1/.p1  ORF type:complete len:189 (+),score=21.00 gb/GECG01001056.1/:1-567(+)
MCTTISTELFGKMEQISWKQRIALEALLATLWILSLMGIFYEPGIMRSKQFFGLLAVLYIFIRLLAAGIRLTWIKCRQYNVEDVFVAAILGGIIFVCGVWQPSLNSLAPILKPYMGTTGFRFFLKFLRSAKREYKIVLETTWRILTLFAVSRVLYILYRTPARGWDWGAVYSKLQTSEEKSTVEETEN